MDFSAEYPEAGSLSSPGEYFSPLLGPVQSEMLRERLKCLGQGVDVVNAKMAVEVNVEH